MYFPREWVLIPPKIVKTIKDTQARDVYQQTLNTKLKTMPTEFLKKYKLTIRTSKVNRC